MAAYAYTHTSKMRKGVKFAPNLTLFAGTLNLTNYNSTNATITEITGKFKTLVAVVPTGPTSSGYFVTWTGTSFKAWRSLTAAASTEAPNDTAIGSVDYIAIGLE